jgi:hypothetical protein
MVFAAALPVCRLLFGKLNGSRSDEGATLSVGDLELRIGELRNGSLLEPTDGFPGHESFFNGTIPNFQFSMISLP